MENTKELIRNAEDRVRMANVELVVLEGEGTEDGYRQHLKR